jgi:5-methylcytosine-specific restriction protein A
MSLNTAFSLFLDEYPKASLGGFAGSAAAEFVREVIPGAVREVIGDNDRYLVEGSPGKGVWAHVPWVAVFDRLITTSAQNGYYLVYLAQEDSTGIFLSLNQGVTSVKAQYGSARKYALRARAADYIAKLGKLADGTIKGPIDLRAKSGASLGADYQVGAICSVYYDQKNLPSDEVLSADLARFLRLYAALTNKEDQLFDQEESEGDEDGIGFEDLIVLREHKRIERNKKLAKSAKKIHGFICKVCEFDFEKIYGPIGRGFIEAHHLTPLASLKGQTISLNPRKDFTVLYANCHRMIHRSQFVGDVHKFRVQHLPHLLLKSATFEKRRTRLSKA